jgi:hypothetical protein
VAPAAAYLAVCAIYRNEAPYLREWIEFHRLVGVERFFLYDNVSTDEHRDVLEPYVAEGIVTLHDWPFFPGQLQAYDHTLREHRDDSRWIAFLDLDEFLFSPAAAKVSDVLPEYEQWAGVGANWAVFGTSGHEHKPEGLVLENYVWRCHDMQEGNRHIKSIVDPTRTEGAGDPHWFRYRNGGFAVDEHHQRIPYARTKSPSWERLRVNHYFTKSKEEFRRKLAKGKADQPEGRASALERIDWIADRLHDERDETIQAYLPALREALAARDPREVPS